ncbi:MAG TPA: hypothetical protein IAC04_05120 [Candidatus Coprenecus stercoravium]|uniref:LPP20 lipoprotein n=1 Tax=Candidatus Coprenecus stercoravium TaxID=2840735 RepID=A0A9D2KAD8_9BACT|nr:hypothetical protein [Candidatus Coprenecus stercoravium]
MKTLRTIICILAASVASVLPSYAQKAQYKILDASAKHMPEWVNSVENGYLIATASGSSIEEAKAAVTESVKQQIAQSIATRVVAESSLLSSYSENADGFSSAQQLETSIVSRTAKLPFISEISLAKATDFYWEQRQWKSNKQTDYFYAVKYPYSEHDMKMLAAQYIEHDNSLNAGLEQFESGIRTVPSVESIGENINRLRVFLDEFDTQDPRYGQVQILSNRYRELYDQITLECVQVSKGKAVVTLKLGGREISTSQRPVLKSNCATQLSSTIEGNAIVIKYNDEYCYEQDDNYIDIRLRAGNKYISERIHIEL